MKDRLASYRHIIWDWNGTLLDDSWLCVETINSLLSEEGLATVDAEQYSREFDFPVRGYYERLGFDFSRLSFETVAVAFIERYYRRLGECRLHPSAAETLDFFHSRGHTQSVLSATEQDRLGECIRHFDLERYFSALVGLDNHYAHSKLECGRAFVETLDIPRREILYIGDTLHDHHVACEMGVDCVLIPGGHHSYERLVNGGARVFESLEALFM